MNDTAPRGAYISVPEQRAGNPIGLNDAVDELVLMAAALNLSGFDTEKGTWGGLLMGLRVRTH